MRLLDGAIWVLALDETIGGRGGVNGGRGHARLGDWAFAVAVVLPRTVRRLVSAAAHFLAHGAAISEYLDPVLQLDFLGAVLTVELRTQDAFDLILADIATVMARHPPNRLAQGVRRRRG